MNNQKLTPLFPPFFTYTQQRLNNLEDKAKEILQNDSNSPFSAVLTIAKQMVDIGEYNEAYQQILAFTERYPFVFFDREGIELARPIVEGLSLDELDLQRLRKTRSLGYVIDSWQLDDGEAMAKQYPYTYYKPSREITQDLQIGNLVKLHFLFEAERSIHNGKDTSTNIPKGERMWLKITHINGECYKGILVNTPFWITDLHYDDEIAFTHKHILDHDMHRHEDNLVDKYSAHCMVNKAIMYDNAPINYLRHDVPHQPEQSDDLLNDLSDDDFGQQKPDSGWSFYTGDESEEYLHNDDNFVMVSLGAILRRDDSFIEYLEMGVGHAFARTEDGFESVEFGLGDNPLDERELAEFGQNLNN